MDFSSREVALEGAYLFIGAFILFLLPLLARLYALKLQNRIILNEMRNRYYHLTGKSFDEKERQLKLGQIIGLRFCKRRRAPKFDGPGDCRQINIQRNKVTNK